MSNSCLLLNELFSSRKAASLTQLETAWLANKWQYGEQREQLLQWLCSPKADHPQHKLWVCSTPRTGLLFCRVRKHELRLPQAQL